MKKTYISFLFILCISAFSLSSIQKAQAQLNVIPGSALGLTPLQLVQNVLLGTGITVSNARFNGSTAFISSNMIGSFTTSGTATTELGLTGGILLTTGKAMDAIGPNTLPDAGSGTATGNDPDLQTILTATTFDKAVLEFDFVPMSSNVSFRYVFGSEEFDEFCGSQYNDVFGFFISGPGISGPYSNSAINIAVMPNNPSNSVTINNICAAGATYSWLNNSGTNYQYDRLSTIYTATCVVQPCQTYHIKLAVGEAIDMFFDSGVFLEENSFSANEISDEVSYSSTVDTVAIEGCNDAIITFHLSNLAASPITINHTVGGTAVEGVDYLDIPDNLIIPTGQDSLNVVITPIADGNPEPTETLVINYSSSICGAQGTIVILIKNYTPLSATASPDFYSCNGQATTISVSAAGGFTPPPLTYLWSESAGNTSSVTVLPGSPTMFYVTVSDACNYSITDSVMVTIGNPVSLTTSVVPETCIGNSDGIATVTSSNGFTPYHYLWSPASDTTATADNLGAGTYTVTVTDAIGCSNTASVTITVTATDNPAFNYSSSFYCQSGADPSANITGGATGSFTSVPPGLVFLNSATGLIDVSASAVNIYTVTFTTNGLCPASSTANVSITDAPSAEFTYSGPYCQDDANPSPTLGPGAGAEAFSATPSGLVFVNTSTGQVDLAASTPGTYTVTNSIAAAAGCAATSATASIIINPVPNVTVPADITVCNNDIIAGTNFFSTPSGAAFTWTNSNTAIGLAAGGSGNISSFTATNTGTTPISATITVVPALNNCTGPSSTYTITVNPTPTVTVPANITVCNNGTISATNFVSTPAGSTITWTNSNTAIGLAANGSGNIASFNATNNGTTPIVATVTITPTLNNCAGIPSTYTITVNPTPTVTVPSDIIVCNNATVAANNFVSTPGGGTFAWTNSNAAIGLAVSGSGNIATFTATNTGTTSISATITVTPTVNSCVGTPSTYTITVNPTPTVNVPANITVCNNGAVAGTTFSSPTPATTFIWTNSNTAIGLTGSGTGDIAGFNATNTGNSPITATITVTPSANTCTGTVSSYTITVNPTPTVTVPANITVCDGATIPGTAFASPVTGATYAWTNSNAAIGLATGNTGDIPAFTATNTGTAPISATITVTPSANGCVGTPSTYTITVNPSPIVVVPANIVVCDGNTVPGTLFTSPTVGATYSWTNSNTAIGLAAGGSGDMPSFTGTNSGTTPIVATITVIATANNCAGAPSTYTITVNSTATVTVPANIQACNNGTVAATNFVSAPTGGAFTWTNSNTAIGLAASGSGDVPSFTATNSGTTPISATITVVPTVSNCAGTPSTYTITVNPTPTVTVPANIIVCNNATVAATNFVSTPGGGTFSWTNSNAAIGLPTSGTGNIAPFTATNTGTTPISATITVTPTVNSCAGTASTYTITVNPTPTVNVIANITICNNGAVSGTTFSSPTPGATYTWTNSNTTIGLPGSGTGDIAGFNATNTGNSPITATITVTPTANTCTGTVSSYTITVNPTPTVTVPANITVCNGATIPGTGFASPVTGATYAWTNSNAAIGLATGNTGDIPAFTATNTGTAPISATITVTPSANGCVGTPSTYTITVNPSPIVVVPANIVVCDGNTVPGTLFTSPTVGATYSWTNSNTTIGLVASGSGDVPSFTGTNSGTTPIVATITVIATANNCAGAPSTYTITVNSTASVTVPANIQACNNGTVAATNFVSAPTGGTFTWANSNTAIGLAASGSGDVPSFTATNNGTTPISATITVVPTVSNCGGAPSTYTITVNPTPTITVPADITVCNNGTVAVTNFISTPGGGTFSWTNSNAAIGLPTSGTGNIASFTATNTGTTPISATITVTPTVNSCVGTPSSYTITVNPTPTVNVPANISVCNNGAVSGTTFSSPTPGATYTWTNSNTTIGLPVSGSGDIAGFNATNTGTSPITATITVTPTANTCTGTASSYTITVNPTPTVTVPANITVCVGATIPGTAFASPVTSATYVWTNSNAAIGLATGNTGDIPAFTATNTDTAPISATITVTPSSNGCVGTPSTYTITVNPSPIVVVPANIVVCNGNAIASTFFTSSTAGATYAWTNSNPTIGLAASGTGDVPSFTASNSGTGAAVATITVIPLANSCTGVPESYTITVNPLPQITFSAMPQVCTTSPAFTMTQASPPNGTYSGNGVAGGIFDPAVAGNGTHTITYNYTDPVTGCSNSNTTQIVISGSLTITVTPNNPIICPENSVLLSASGANTFNWQPDTTLSTLTGSNVVATPVSTTTYTVVGNNPDGCAGSTTVTVGVYNVPVILITSMPKEGCSPLDVNFLYGPTGQIDTNTITWNFGDPSSAVNTSTLTTPAHTFNDNDNYTIHFSAQTTDGCPVSATDTVKVYLKPVADFYFNPEVPYATNPVVDFTDLSIYANSWQWDFDDPASDAENSSGTQNPTHIYTDTGTFLVQLIVYNNSSCSDTIEKPITIKPEIIVFIPNAFTPDKDGNNETFRPIISGIDESSYEFYIYDRWGNIQFFTNDVNTAWDGKKKGKYIESGIYIYYIIYHSVLGKEFSRKGMVTLIR